MLEFWAPNDDNAPRPCPFHVPHPHLTDMARRLYLGRLPPDTRQDDVNKFFDGFGRIVDCRVMTGFGFVEFESSRDADDALQHFQGKPFMGQESVIITIG
jgi:RNA recognition motif-containing protein